MEMLLIFMIALVLAWWMGRNGSRITSDDDLMERYIVLSHRQQRKARGLTPLY